MHSYHLPIPSRPCLVRPARFIALALLVASVLRGHWGHAAESATAESQPVATTNGLALVQPLDYQVIQRASRSGGVIPIRAAWPATLVRTDTVGGQRPKAEARLVPAGGAATAWQQLAEWTAGATNLSAELAAPSGGWHRLELRIRLDDRVLASATVEHVGLGEVFVVAGQSNSANHGEEKQKPASGLVTTFTGQRWQPAVDPQPGASGSGGSFIPPFGDALARQLGVPIGIVAVGSGGTSVREWLPRGDRFPNPPTVTGNVRRLESGEWESRGGLYANLIARLRPLGNRGFRAVLWHQGESDANQTDASRTLPGGLYRDYLTRLIRESRRELGWEFPWFVAQVSYHTPDDPGSPEIRAAQAALWRDGIALEGPDTDALTGPMRDGGGKGVHFSGAGLRAHGAAWAARVGPWVERQLAAAPEAGAAKARSARSAARLSMPQHEEFEVAGRPAFVYLPPDASRKTPQPWILYAPTLPGLPDNAERWMHEQFLAAGVAVAGVDVGEGYGSPRSHAALDALYRELTERRGFALKPVLLGRSRGGLWVSSWAIANPSRVAGIAGIYPVFDLRSYPGLKNAAPAYGLSPDELAARLDTLNPVARLDVLARAGVPVVLVHGDVDKVVPLEPNSGELVRRYREAGAGERVRLIVLPGQGHNMFEGFFRSQELIDFAIARARN